MLNLTTDLPRVKELLDKAQEVLIVTHEKPTFDSIGSSLALYLGLVSLGKKVTISCPEAMTVALSNFIGVDKIVTEVSKKNFVVSLDYVEGSIEKVSYNIEGDKFNLVIEPRAGFDVFSADKVHYSNTGTLADVIFCVDTIHLGGLKKLYESDKELYASKPVVNIDRHPNNAQYGAINLIDPQASSTAEVMARVLSGLGVKLTVDIATNLINAVYAATDNFNSPNVTASAFELAAVCIKGGGKRFSTVAAPEPTKQEEMPVREVAQTQPVETVAPLPVEGTPTPTTSEATGKEAPADWLKPKIFKSSSGSHG